MASLTSGHEKRRDKGRWCACERREKGKWYVDVRERVVRDTRIKA
jgi:hypothetical protein